METYENPISSKSRGRIFVSGIVLSTVATTAAAVLVVLGLPVLAAIVGIVGNAYAGLSQTLARANLTPDDIVKVPQNGSEVVL